MLLAILAGGCGGGSSTTASGAHSPQTSATSTHAATSPGAHAGGSAELQFIARADAICKRVGMQIAHSQPAHLTPAEIARRTPAHVAFEQQGLRELAALKVPPALAAHWQQILAYMRTLPQELVALTKAAKANDKHTIKMLAASKKRLHAQLRAAAKRDGFKDCQKV